MANTRYQGYQYETSPRKLEPEYEVRKNPYKQKKSSIKRKNNTNNKQGKTTINGKVKMVFCIAIGFIILFAISYQNSLITETFNKKESLKSQLATIEKENEQLKVNIEKSLNLNNVEQMAKEKLGMQKLSNDQKIYITLPKQDYIESSKQDVGFVENKNIFEKIIEFFK